MFTPSCQPSLLYYLHRKSLVGAAVFVARVTRGRVSHHQIRSQEDLLLKLDGGCRKAQYVNFHDGVPSTDARSLANTQILELTSTKIWNVKVEHSPHP